MALNCLRYIRFLLGQRPHTSPLPCFSRSEFMIMAECKEKFTFFWKSESPFSQWYACKFKVDDTLYNSAEQYMMHQKAVLFHDEEIAAAIMKSDSPKKQKSLGRKVKNFDADVWNDKCKDIVKKGNIAKFSQNSELKEMLLKTDGSTLAEASPIDTIWGIGYAADHPNAKTKSKWRGKNWLGYALTEAREEIIKMSSTSS